MRSLLVTLLLAALLPACSLLGDDEGGDSSAVSPSVTRLIDCCTRERYLGTMPFVFQIDDRVYFGGNSFGYLEVGTGFQVQSAVELAPFSNDSIVNRGPGRFYGPGRDDEHFLVIASIFGDASAGGLFEYSAATDSVARLRDSSFAVSSAVYRPGSGGRELVYYSYGSSRRLGNEGKGLTPGYYQLDTETGDASLLLEYRSPLGPGDGLQSFDISPDGRTLLHPVMRATERMARPPHLVEYDLQTRTADTLDVTFESPRGRTSLWVRYSPEGDRILYSLFPQSTFAGLPGGGSEVGVIERATGAKRILPVNTDEEVSVQVAPTWGPEGEHIVYGSAEVILPRGAATGYDPYVFERAN